jgi:hypothetical protein
LTPGN